MKIKLTKQTILIALAGIMIVAGIVFQTIYKRNTAAYVNDTRISMGSINSQFEAMKKRDPRRFSGSGSAAKEKQIKRMLLDDQIAITTIAEYAAKAGIKVSVKEVDQVFNTFRQTYKTKEAFEKAQAKQGNDEAYLRNLFRKEIAARKMRTRLVEEVTVSEREITQYAEKNRATFEKAAPQVKLSVLTLEGSDQAEKAAKLLKGSGGFDSVARKMGVKTVDWGWQIASDLDRGIEKALSKIDVGEYTRVIPNPGNTLSIYKIDDRQTRKSNPGEIRKQIKTTLLNRKQRQSFHYWYEGIQEKAEVQVFM